MLSSVQDCLIWVVSIARHLLKMNSKLSVGNFHCLFIQTHHNIEKQQAIFNLLHEHIQNTSERYEYTTTNQTMKCTDESNNVVVFRAELLSPPNMMESVLDSIRSWTSKTPSIIVQGLRLNLKNDCSLVVESFDSPLDCLQELAPTFSSSSNPPVTVTHTSTVTMDHPQERHPSTLSVIEVLVIIGFLGCGILIVVVLLLVLYIAYKHYKESIQKAQRLR